MRASALALCFAFVSLIASVAHASRDGRVFDQGATMTAPAERASAETAELLPMLGHFDVHFSWFASDSLVHDSEAVAELQFMNRGHGLIERFFCKDFDGQGHELSTIAFLMQTPSSGAWRLAIADSYRENIRSFDGSRDGKTWSYHTVLRARGGANLIEHRVEMRIDDSDHFVVQATQGVLGQESQRVWRREYSRRAGIAPALQPREDYGMPAEGLPVEARQFDFLVGEWDFANENLLPNGKTVRYPTHATAVHAMNGSAILEHSWNDVDPNVPDAATTIVRVYNRAMRRWESMYSTNRFNGVLYFGGVMEGDRIVLHSFEADASDTPYSYWIFHDMKEKRYGWYGNTSRDRGETFQKTWIIEATRRESSR